MRFVRVFICTVDGDEEWATKKSHSEIHAFTNEGIDHVITSRQ
jgi:hypothetical protein